MDSAVLVVDLSALSTIGEDADFGCAADLIKDHVHALAETTVLSAQQREPSMEQREAALSELRTMLQVPSNLVTSSQALATFQAPSHDALRHAVDAFLHQASLSVLVRYPFNSAFECVYAPPTLTWQDFFLTHDNTLQRKGNEDVINAFIKRSLRASCATSIAVDVVTAISQRFSVLVQAASDLLSSNSIAALLRSVCFLHKQETLQGIVRRNTSSAPQANGGPSTVSLLSPDDSCFKLIRVVSFAAAQESNAGEERRRPDSQLTMRQRSQLTCVYDQLRKGNGAVEFVTHGSRSSPFPFQSIAAYFDHLAEDCGSVRVEERDEAQKVGFKRHRNEEEDDEECAEDEKNQRRNERILLMCVRCKEAISVAEELESRLERRKRLDERRARAGGNGTTGGGHAASCGLKDALRVTFSQTLCATCFRAAA